MLDEHIIPDGQNWGIAPVLFSIQGVQIHSYGFFILLAVIAASLYYLITALRDKTLSENTIYIAFASIIGGVLGAKIPIWIMNFPEIIRTFPDPNTILSGRTIVGGLIGGALSVKLIKHILKIKERKGNIFAPAVALAIGIGRIGCFLRGCCFGIATSLPWGVDFGDGILRHPTELYESIFGFVMFFYLLYAKKKNPAPGSLFTLFLNSYFTFRFAEEFLRYGQPMIGFFTIYQVISLTMLCIINLRQIKILDKFIHRKQ